MTTHNRKKCAVRKVGPKFSHLMTIHCEHMHSYRIPEVCFATGSVVELPLFYTVMNLTDSDSMLSPINICALSREHGTKKKAHLEGGTVLYIDTEHTRPGYARLEYADGRLHRHTEPTDHGPAATIWLSSYNFKPSTPAHLAEWKKQILPFARDTVYAIRCPRWPAEAAEWETRSRPSGWPEKELVNRVISFGCHFVQKPHQSHPDDSTEWRYSSQWPS